MIVSDLRVLAAGVARSWREHHALMLAAWLATAAVCVWAAADSGLYFFRDFRDGGGPWCGAITLLSTFGLVGAGVSLLLVARRVFERDGWSTTTLAWTAGGVGGLLLALDEIGQVHEAIARRLERLGVPAPFGVGDRDLYVFAVYALLVLFALRGAWPQLRRWSDAWLPGVAAVVLFVASAAVDAVPWEALTRAQRDFWGPVEEGLKTAGTVSFALFGVLMAEAAARDASLSESRGGERDTEELRRLVRERLAAAESVQSGAGARPVGLGDARATGAAARVVSPRLAREGPASR